MKSSGISSATAAPTPLSAPTPATAGSSPPDPSTREHFALTGPSVVLDPLTYAVRPDLADIRLARHVFAPHYAAPVARTLVIAAPLRRERAAGSEVLATLAAGTRFDMLDLTGNDAWGIAPGEQVVGYLDRAALGDPEA